MSSFVSNSTTLPVRWKKSSYSGGNGDCVEAANHTGAIAVRDSKNPEGPAHIHPRAAFDAFLSAVAGNSLVPVA